MLYVPKPLPDPSGRRAQIEAAVRCLLDLRRQGDVSAICERLSDDFVYRAQGNWPMWPFHCGPLDRDQYGDALRRFNAETEVASYEIHEFVIEGDSAAVHTTVTSRIRGSGPWAQIDMWMVWRFRGDVAVEAATYVDVAGVAPLIHGGPIEVRSAGEPKTWREERPTRNAQGSNDGAARRSSATATMRPNREFALELERQAVENAIRRIFEWRQRCDIDGVYQSIAPDFSFMTRGTWSVRPFGARQLDRFRFAEALGRVNVEVETLGRDYAEFLIDGDSAAVHWTAWVRNRGSGPTYALGSWAYFRIRDGLMTECAYYPDSSRAPGLGPPFRVSRSVSPHYAD